MDEQRVNHEASSRMSPNNGQQQQQYIQQQNLGGGSFLGYMEQTLKVQSDSTSNPSHKNFLERKKKFQTKHNRNNTQTGGTHIPSSYRQHYSSTPDKMMDSSGREHIDPTRKAAPLFFNNNNNPNLQNFSNEANS